MSCQQVIKSRKDTILQIPSRNACHSCEPMTLSLSGGAIQMEVVRLLSHFKTIQMLILSLLIPLTHHQREA